MRKKYFIFLSLIFVFITSKAQPMSIILRAITSIDENKIRKCIHTLLKTHADTGFMHESFYQDDATKFTRKWFAWANEMIV